MFELRQILALQQEENEGEQTRKLGSKRRLEERRRLDEIEIREESNHEVDSE